MANDFECTKCGYREAAHDCAQWDDPANYPSICSHYRRSREEYNFDRRREAAQRKRDREAANRPINHSVLMITPYGVIDIGS